MRRLSDWYHSRRGYLILVFTTVVSLVLIFSNDEPRIETLRAVAFTGFGLVLEKIVLWQRYDDVFQENSWLRQENAELMIENSQFREAVSENQRLRALLNFKDKSELVLLPAKVIGKKESRFSSAIMLDVGSSAGIMKNMTVVTSEGLVGKILSVSGEYSIAQLLLDTNFRVSAMIQRSRVAGVVKPLAGGRIVLAEVQKRADVQAGDIVVTSGLSTIFPGGLIVGRVLDVEEGGLDMFKAVDVEPSVDFSRLEEVFVVRMDAITGLSQYDDAN